MKSTLRLSIALGLALLVVIGAYRFLVDGLDPVPEARSAAIAGVQQRVETTVARVAAAARRLPATATPDQVWTGIGPVLSGGADEFLLLSHDENPLKAAFQVRQIASGGIRSATYVARRCLAITVVPGPPGSATAADIPCPAQVAQTWGVADEIVMGPAPTQGRT